jgi:hypothetical protein
MTTATDKLIDRVSKLERYDYASYLKQVEEFSSEDQKAIYADWRLYRRAFCWVIENRPDGMTRAVRFEPRAWQIAYEQTRTLNDIFLKARKVGCSTDILTEMYAKSCIRAHQRSAIMSHEEDATKRLLSILQTIQQYNPMAPPLAVSNTEGMTFKWTSSRIWIGTAGARVFGRGDDLSMLHLSEAAHFYKKIGDVDNFMAGISEAVSKGGRMVIESTPNGMDPIYYPRWESSKNGELWNGILLTVFDDESTDWAPDHPLVLPSTRKDTFETSEYEQLLMANKGARLGHIRFLRWEKERMAIKSEMNPSTNTVLGDEDILLQEYPVDDVSCFINADDTVFDTSMVRLYEARAHPPMFTELRGAIRLWEKALTGHSYVVFVDTSEGLPTSNWQAAAVLDVDRLKYVATLRTKTDLTDLAKISYDLATSFNEALLMVERNNHGHAVLLALEHMGYENLYYHHEHGSPVRSGERRLGFPTRSSDTKPDMIRTFKELFEAGALDMQDSDVLREVATYRYRDPRTRGLGFARDRYGAPSGGTDDLLMAHMGALMGRFEASSGQRAEVTHYGQRFGDKKP